MKLWAAAILTPAFVWAFAYVLLWAVEDQEYCRSRAGRTLPWLLAAPVAFGFLLSWLIR